MKKVLALLSIGLMSSGAWAGGALFNDNPDISGSILQDLGQPAVMGEREMGLRDLYGTSLEQWDGEVRVGVTEFERGTGDLYGSVLYDVNPDLRF